MGERRGKREGQRGGVKVYPKLEEAAILDWRGGDLSFWCGGWDSDRRGESEKGDCPVDEALHGG